jgi:hypothetical protein
MKFSVVSFLACVSVATAFVAPRPISPHALLTTTTSRFVASTAAEAPPLSPLTQWGDRIPNIRQVQQSLKQQDLPEFAPELSAVKDLGLARDDTVGQLKYIQEHAQELKLKMQQHGAIVFRDFDLMKTQDGFVNFYKALGMHVCLDPLHSVSARPTVDGTKNSPVYEAVNKESRKNFFIGT